MISNINKDNSKVLDLVNPVYILDYPEADAKLIENKYGVIFLPVKNTPKPILVKRGWEIDTSDVSKPRTWEFFLKGNKTKYNSVVIVDRYFFASQSGESFEDSLFNLRAILNVLVPDKMYKFTVSIIFDESKGEYLKEKILQIGATPFVVGELKALLGEENVVIR